MNKDDPDSVDLEAMAKDLGFQIQKHATPIMANVAVPGHRKTSTLFVLQTTATLSNDLYQRLRKQWDDLQLGPQHKMILLEGGMTIQEFEVEYKVPIEEEED